MVTNRFSPSQVQQWRRDAKRIARERGIQHSAALDSLAAEQGFQNWSVLLKHVGPAEARAVEGAESADQDIRLMSQLPRMDASKQELGYILAIVKRFERIIGDKAEVNRMSLLMDLEACHCNGCPLDLLALLESPRELDLVHDVAGIARHLDRETGQLQGFFRPRFASRRHPVSR